MDDKGFDGINVIPFIDIMLVLLTIVLTTATFIASGTIPVNLPKAEGSTVTEDRGLTVEIDQTGKVFFRGAEHTITALRTALLSENRQTPFLIRADRAVKLQAFVEVMGLIRELGFSRLGLQTETSR